MRRVVYVGSLMAVGALLDELTYWVVTHHGIDRAVRWLDEHARL